MGIEQNGKNGGVGGGGDSRMVRMGGAECKNWGGVDSRMVKLGGSNSRMVKIGGGG